MFKIMLALHLLTAIFVIGPLVGAATTASRGLRGADAGATATSARTITVYSYASLLVVIFGFGLMSATSPYTHKAVAEFSDAWIWISLLLWVVAVAVALFAIVPALQQATTRIGAGESIDALKGRVAGTGGVVGLIFLAIVFLMVYQPGS